MELRAAAPWRIDRVVRTANPRQHDTKITTDIPARAWPAPACPHSRAFPSAATTTRSGTRVLSSRLSAVASPARTATESRSGGGAPRQA